MTTTRARTILQDDKAPLPAVTEAAATIARAPGSTLDDLFACLDRGGLAAEFAAMELYQRTHRPVPADGRRISLDRAEWRRFLEGATGKLSLAKSRPSNYGDGATACWVDLYSGTHFKGRLHRLKGPGLAKPQKFRSLIVGPNCNVEIRSGTKVTKLRPSQRVGDLLAQFIAPWEIAIHPTCKGNGGKSSSG